MDTSGKDGTIRKVFEGVNPQGVRVAQFKVPTPEEEAHDFLWRAHAKMPAKGEVVIFNRSHYEDVLVTRVHRLVGPRTWRERYGAINAFERSLTEEGTTVVKFFLHIDSAEQKARLDARVKDPDKRWKFSDLDLHERKFWNAYMRAYEGALSHTSTEYAPWYVVPSNRKWYRDLVVCRVICETLEAMRLRYPDLSREPRVARGV